MYLGDNGPAYAAWAAAVDAQGGKATTWPFDTGLYAQYAGQAAAAYPTAVYVQLANSGQLDMSAPQQAGGSNQVFYVLAPASVQAAAPATMTTAQSVENKVLSTLDSAADSVGLGGVLQSLQNALQGAGKYLLIGGGVLLLLPLVTSRLRKNPRGRRRHRRGAGR